MALPELRIELEAPCIRGVGPAARAAARVRLVSCSSGNAALEGPLVDFESPLCSADLNELKWYLEANPLWPEELFAERAAKVEAAIPRWGRSLFDATLGRHEQQEILEAFRSACDADPERGCTITVIVDEGGPAEGQAERGRAAALLWSLPWETLADEEGYLSLGSMQAVVRRSLPGITPARALEVQRAFRVLLVIARPQEPGTPFLDPRMSALPLARALASLGSAFELTTLPVGSFEALENALEAAEEEGRPYSVVHFDGHGSYDEREHRGLLHFEEPPRPANDAYEWPRPDLVDSAYFGARLSQHRIGLVFLEACQSAAGQGSITASVAARLHEYGGVSVVAMGHAVRAEASGRFVEAFYSAIASGEGVGGAMLRGRQALQRGPTQRSMRGVERRMQDWFLPALFQCGRDARLVPDAGSIRRVSLREYYGPRFGALPPVPLTNLLGRAKEMIIFDRLFQEHRVLALRGMAGDGKTMVAVSLAHWMLAIERFDKVAYASCGPQTEPAVSLRMLQQQLVPPREDNGLDADQAISLHEALLARRCLLILDDVEGILPAQFEAPSQETIDLLSSLVLLAEIGQTRVLFVTRVKILDDIVSILHVDPGVMDNESLTELLNRTVVDAGETWGLDRAVLDKAAWTRLRRFGNQVGWHVRTMVLLAPLVVEQALMGRELPLREAILELERRHPGDPRRSVLTSGRRYAELLDPSVRRRVRRIGVFRKAAQVTMLAYVLQIDLDECVSLCRTLIQAGLATEDGVYLLPEPGFLAAMWLEMDPVERATAEHLWFHAVERFVGLLGDHMRVDLAHVDNAVNLLAPDIEAYCRSLIAEVDAGHIELERALGGLSNIQLLGQMLRIDDFLQSIDFTRQSLLSRTKGLDLTQIRAVYWQAEAALAEDDFDEGISRAEELTGQLRVYDSTAPEVGELRARVHKLLGRAFFMTGRAREAIGALEVAKRAIDADPALAWMSAGILINIGNALADLGRLDEALDALNEALQIAKAREDHHSVHAAIAQRSNVFLLQGRLHEALEGYEDILELSGALCWSENVAVASHQIGIILRCLGQFELAEQYLRNALAIKKKELGGAGAGRTVVELANVYSDQDRHEEALALLDGIRGHADFLDPFCLGTLLHNKGLCLLHIGRLDEARAALHDAADLKGRLGHAAEPWKPWLLLSDLEQKAGRMDAARDARRKSFARYKAYRQSGGAPTTSSGRLFARLGETAEKDPQAAKEMLSWIKVIDESRGRKVRRTIESLAEGTLDPDTVNLEDDCDFEIYDAVEILLAAERHRKT